MIGRKKWKDKTKNKRNAINVGGGILNRRCEAFLLTHWGFMSVALFKYRQNLKNEQKNYCGFIAQT